MLRRVSEGAPVEPLELSELKALLRIDDDVFDTQLPLLLASSREIVEHQTGRALVEADYEWTPIGQRRLPLPLWPATVTSPDGDYPIMFTTEPGVVPSALKVAIALLVGDALKNPDMGITAQMIESPAFQRAIWSCRRMDV